MTPVPGPATGPRPIPVVRGVPGLGSALALLRDPVSVLVDAHAEHGPVFALETLGHRMVVMAGPEAHAFFLEHGESHFTRAALFHAFESEIGTPLFGDDGPERQALRDVLKLAFSRELAMPHTGALAVQIGAEVRSWPAGSLHGALAAGERLALLAYDATSGGSWSVHAGDARRYARRVLQVVTGHRPALALRDPLYVRSRERMRGLATALCAAARPGDATSPALLVAQADAETAVAGVLYGLVAHVGYVGRGIGFLLYELLKHPDLARRVECEARAAFSGDPRQDAGVAARLPTLRDAWAETLRLHPIVLGLPFHARHDFEFAGCRIARGTLLLLSHIPSHYSPAFYRSPRAFDATRCTAPRNEHRTPGAWTPFGFGSRACTAPGLVEQATLTAVASLLRHATLALARPGETLATRLDPLPGPDSRLRFRVVAHASAPERSAGVAVRDEERLAAYLPLVARHADRLARAETRRHPPGSLIVRQSAPAEHFFVVLEGEVEVFQGSGGDAEARARMGPGESFGEVGLLTGAPRSASVRAGSAPVTLLALGREDFLALVRESDLLAAEIAEVVQRRFLAARLADALPGIDATRLAGLLPEFVRERRAAGAVVVRQGEPADAFYLILRGVVRVSARRADGEDVTLGDLGAGEYFGETGLLESRPRTATVTVLSAEVELAALPREAFLRLVRESPAARQQLADTLCRRALSALSRLG